jgi:hypothetical protein
MADEPAMRLPPIYHALRIRTKAAVREDELVRIIRRGLVVDVFTF